MGQLDKYVIEMGYISGSEVLLIRIFIKVMIRPGSGVLRISNFIKYKDTFQEEKYINRGYWVSVEQLRIIRLYWLNIGPLDT